MKIKFSAIVLYAMLSGAAISAGFAWSPVYTFFGFLALAVMVLVAG